MAPSPDLTSPESIAAATQAYLDWLHATASELDEEFHNKVRAVRCTCPEEIEVRHRTHCHHVLAFPARKD